MASIQATLLSLMEQTQCKKPKGNQKELQIEQVSVQLKL